MEALMQDFQLTLHHIVWRMEKLFARKTIVTKREHGLHRYTYAALAAPARRLAPPPTRPALPARKPAMVMSAEPLDDALDYETLLAAESPDFVWPQLDEDAPMAMCYTSGTTGHPDRTSTRLNSSHVSESR